MEDSTGKSSVCVCVCVCVLKAARSAHLLICQLLVDSNTKLNPTQPLKGFLFSVFLSLPAIHVRFSCSSLSSLVPSQNHFSPFRTLGMVGL